MFDPANRAAAIDELKTEFGLQTPLAAATFDALAHPTEGLFQDARIDVAGVEAVLALRVQAGLLDASPPPSKYYDARYLA